MDAYQTLAQQAAIKRDKAIADARKEYQRDIKTLTRLMRSLNPKAGTAKLKGIKPAATLSLIKQVMPTDRAWTVPQLVKWLEAAAPDFAFNELNVRNLVSQLGRRGELRKLYKTPDNYWVWVSAECPTDGGPLASRAIRDVIAEVLKSGPMTVTEAAVALREIGYRNEASAKALTRAVSDTFRRYPDWFTAGEGGRWGLASP